MGAASMWRSPLFPSPGGAPPPQAAPPPSPATIPPSPTTAFSRPPPFPGNDPRFGNEGFRQAVADLRVLMTLLRERGAPSVGIMGMSLGGYASALLATVQRDLAFAVPMIPLASLANAARDQGRLGS